MKEYSYEEVLGFLRATVAERGEDFVYEHRRLENGCEGCYYAWEGEPDCGVGQMLHDYLNVPIALLQEMDARGGAISMQFDALLTLGNIEFDPDAKALMTHFQKYQDDGYMWGESLGMAVRFMARFGG